MVITCAFVSRIVWGRSVSVFADEIQERKIKAFVTPGQKWLPGRPGTVSMSAFLRSSSAQVCCLSFSH